MIKQTKVLLPWQQDFFECLGRSAKMRSAHMPMLLVAEPLQSIEPIQWLLQWLLCEESGTQTGPCGVCHSCQLFLSGHHPDHYSIVSSIQQQLKFEQIQPLEPFLQKSAYVTNKKVIFIGWAEHMNTYSVSLLLKLLEENYENHWLLLTAHPRLLLPALRSRCMIYHLPSAPVHVLNQWLETALPHTSVQQRKQVLALSANNICGALTALQEERLKQSICFKHDIFGLITSMALFDFYLQWFVRADIDWSFRYWFQCTGDELQHIATMSHDDFAVLSLQIWSWFQTASALYFSWRVGRLMGNFQLHCQSLLLDWIDMFKDHQHQCSIEHRIEVDV